MLIVCHIISLTIVKHFTVQENVTLRNDPTIMRFDLNAAFYVGRPRVLGSTLWTINEVQNIPRKRE